MLFVFQDPLSNVVGSLEVIFFPPYRKTFIFFRSVVWKTVKWYSTWKGTLRIVCFSRLSCNLKVRFRYWIKVDAWLKRVYISPREISDFGRFVKTIVRSGMYAGVLKLFSLGKWQRSRHCSQIAVMVLDFKLTGARGFQMSKIKLKIYFHIPLHSRFLFDSWVVTSVPFGVLLITCMSLLTLLDAVER